METGVCWPVTQIQMSTPPTVYHFTLQAIYKERLRRGEKPDDCHIPTQRG
jgi:hypothetical protein